MRLLQEKVHKVNFAWQKQMIQYCRSTSTVTGRLVWFGCPENQNKLLLSSYAIKEKVVRQ